MMSAFDFIIPGILLGSAVWGLYKKVNVFEAITTGAMDGAKTVLNVFPNLVCLLTAVYMLRASGALEAFAMLFAPVLGFFGIPAETVALLVVRPVSGSGAFAVGAELIQTYGADSLIGRTVAVMLGSTETTFYVVAVYFGAVGIRKTRYAIPVALMTDFIGFFVAALTVRLFF